MRIELHFTGGSKEFMKCMQFLSYGQHILFKKTIGCFLNSFNTNNSFRLFTINFSSVVLTIFHKYAYSQI